MNALLKTTWTSVIVGIIYIWAFLLCVGAFKTDVRVLVALGLIPLGSILTTFVHELGHALAARLVGWRVIVFSVQGLTLQLPNRNLVANRRTRVDGAAGWVSAVPSAPRFAKPLRRVIFIAGGPAISLAQAITMYCLAVFVASPEGYGQVKPNMLAGVFALLGLASFVATSIPNNKRNGNDSAKLLALWRSIRAGKPLEPTIWIQTLLAFNVRLRDVPNWMIKQSFEQRESSGPHLQFFDTLEIGRTLDAKVVDVIKARTQLDTYWLNHEPNDWLKACDAYLAAANERDLDRATAMVAQIGEPSDLPQMACAAKAATKMLAGERASANILLDEMDGFIRKKSPYADLTFRDIRARIEAIVPL